MTCVSPQCVSTEPSKEAYRPLQTAVIRSAGYTDHDYCNGAARSTKEQKEQPKRPSMHASHIENTFFLQHDAHTPLPCTRACHALQARMLVAPATVPVFGSLRLAFGNTDSEWPDFHIPKKSNTSRFKALVAIIFLWCLI